MNKRFLFIGGDKRMLFARRYLSEHYVCDTLGLSENAQPVGRYDFIVLPLPVSRCGDIINAPLSGEPLVFSLIMEYAAQDAVVFSGGTNAALSSLCAENGIPLIDYFSDEALTLENAALTAEAAAAILSQSTEGSLFGSSVTVTGYGRVARYTARILRCFGADVTIFARREEQRTLAHLDGFDAIDTVLLDEFLPYMDFIVNTVPARIIPDETFAALKRGAVYMELASLPPDSAKRLCEQSGATYIHAAGLPGKCSPATAGRLIAETIMRLLPH